MKQARLALGFSLAALLSACQGSGAALLGTSLPELSAYVELFHQEHPEHRILLEYLPEPAIALAEENWRGDLLIGRGLQSRGLISRFQSLNFVLDRGEVRANDFYGSFLELGRQADHQLVLPFQFQLPVLLYRSGGGSDERPSMLLEWTQLFAEAEARTQSDTRRGFLWEWRPHFMLAYLRGQGLRFREEPAGQLSWDLGAFNASLSALKSSQSQLGSAEPFLTRHKPLPPLRVLSDGALLYHGADLKDVMALAPAQRRSFDFRYPAEKGLVPVNEDLIFAGILSSAPQRSTAEAFVLWFYNPSTLARLLKHQDSLGLRTFGVAGGLSPLKAFNSGPLAESRDLLQGRLPSEAQLDFPSRLPSRWPELRSQVVGPWLERTLADETSPAELRARLDEWRLQNRLY